MNPQLDLTKKFFALMQSKGYLIEVPSKDFETADVSALKVNDAGVPFKYGAKTLRGTVLFLASTQAEIKMEIERILKERKLKKASSGSFHAENPRKAKVKALETNMVTGKGKTKASEPAQVKASQSKRERKKQAAMLKDQADLMAEAEMGSSGSKSANKNKKPEDPSTSRKSEDSETSKKSDDESDSSSDSDGSSSMSSIPVKDKKNSVKDARAFKNICSDSSDKSDSIKNKNYVVDSDDEQDKESNKKKYVEDSDDDQDKKRIKNKYVEDSDDELDKNGQPDVNDIKESTVELKEIKASGKVKAGNGSEDQKNKEVDIGLGKKEDTSKVGLNFKIKKNKEEKLEPKLGVKVKLPDSEDVSSSDSAMSEDEQPPVKRIKRNRTVYEGVNYLFKKKDPGTVQLHPPHEVYVLKEDLESVSTSANTPMGFIRNMVEKVYTQDALMNCTAQGFPPRSKGSKKLKKLEVQPAIHPAGRAALIAKAKDLQKTTRTDWKRRDDSVLSNAFSQRLSEIKKSA